MLHRTISGVSHLSVSIFFEEFKKTLLIDFLAKSGRILLRLDLDRKGFLIICLFVFIERGRFWLWSQLPLLWLCLGCSLLGLTLVVWISQKKLFYFRFFKLMEYRFLKHSLIAIFISLVSILMFLCSFLILLIWVISSFLLVS